MSLDATLTADPSGPRSIRDPDIGPVIQLLTSWSALDLSPAGSPADESLVGGAKDAVKAGQEPKRPDPTHRAGRPWAPQWLGASRTDPHDAPGVPCPDCLDRPRQAECIV